MPSSPAADDTGADDAPHLTRWERLKYSMVRPDDDPKERPKLETRPRAEVEAEIARSSDKERMIGLIAGPVAAIVGLLISGASINYARSHGQSTGVFEKLTWVLLALAILILLTSWLRKRLFQGITLALFGVAIFQLHYSYIGFALPFILFGAWFLIRSYRLQQELKRAEAADPGTLRSKASPTAAAPRPRRNKRYTPPS
jgi:Ca2+/Na+ antiporter